MTSWPCCATTEAGTLVDTNVPLDIVDADPQWEPWSSQQLAAAFERGPVIIHPLPKLTLIAP